MYKQLFETLFAQNSQALLQCDAQGYLLAANDAACTLLADTPEILIGREFRQLFGTDLYVDHPTLQTFWKDGRQSWQGHVTHGDVRLRLTLTRVCDEADELVLAALELAFEPLLNLPLVEPNCTTIKASGEASKVNPTPTQSTPAFTILLMAIMHVDRQWQITYFNGAAMGTGKHAQRFTPEDVIGRSLWEVLPYLNEADNPFGQAYRHAMTYGEPVHVEAEARDPGILGKWHRAYAIPVEDGLWLHGTDDTDRKRAEQALAQALQEREVMFNSIADYVVVLNERWRYVYANDAAQKRHPQGLIGKSFFDVFARGGVFEERYRQAFSIKRPIYFEAQSSLDGTWMELRVFPSGNNIIIYGVNISERKQLALELEKALQDKEDILSSITDSFGVLDNNWCFVYVNSKASNISQEVIGKNYFDVFPQNKDTIFEEKYRQAFDTQQPVKFEAIVTSSKRWNEVRVYPNSEGIAIFSSDIHERKQLAIQLEQTLQEKEEILESITDSFGILDKNWCFLYANSKASKISPQILGKNYFEVFPHNRGTIFEEKYRQAFETQQPVTFEATMSVNKRWYEVRVYPRPEGIAIFSSDIHERKQLAVQLAQALQEKEDILNSITDSVLVIDRNWNFVYANHNTEKYYSVGLIGRNYWDVYPHNRGSVFEQQYQHVFDTAQPTRFVAQMSKSEMWCEVRVFPSPEGIAVYIANIDELKRKEDALENALAAKEMLLKEVHHRTKNNMQLISSMLSIQAHTLTDDTSRKAVLESRDRINVLADVHKLMYQQLEAETINAHNHLSALIYKLSRSMGRSNLSVDLGIEAINLTIQQAIPLGLIVNELVTNIFKHAFATPSNDDGISLKVYLEDGQIVLELHDNGVGLPDGFDPNQDSLGMTIIQALTGQLAGTLTMHNQQVGGVLTKLSFPQETLSERT